MVKEKNTEILAKSSNQRITFSDKRTNATIGGNVHDDRNKVGNNCETININFIAKYLHEFLIEKSKKSNRDKTLIHSELILDKEQCPINSHNLSFPSKMERTVFALKLHCGLSNTEALVPIDKLIWICVLPWPAQS